MKPYCGTTLDKSLDYLLDIASVTGQNLSDKSDLDSICQISFEKKELDSNFLRGNWMGCYLTQIIGIRTRRYILFALFMMLLICLFTSFFFFRILDFTVKTLLVCVMTLVLVVFIYFLANVAKIQKDPANLFELRERTNYGLTPKEILNMNYLLPEEYSEGYSKIPDKPSFNFPFDHQINHYTYPTEWYWYVATLKDKQTDDLYSVELVFLRQSVISPSVLCTIDQTLENTQIYETYIKIGSAKDKKMYQGRDCAIPWVSGLVGLGYKPFSISIGNNVLYGTSSSEMFPLQWNIIEPINSVSAKLTLASAGKIIFRGDNGLDPPDLRGLGIGTLYYSWPQVQTEGMINFNGKEIQVEGVGWIDHQIFRGISPLGRITPVIPRIIGNLSRLFNSKPVNGGWDFIIILMEDKSTYYFTRGLNDIDLDRNDGIYLIGKYSSSDGRQDNIVGLGQIVRRVVRNGVAYPSAWKIETGKLSFYVQSITDDIFVSMIQGEVVEIGATVMEEITKTKGTGWIENVGYGPNDTDNYKRFLGMS